MHVRNVLDSDLNAITALILLCSEKYILPDFSDEGVAAYRASHSLEKMKERIQMYDYQVLVNESDQIFGVVGMQPVSHLFHLHVDPKAHGQGLGRQLWEHAKKSVLSKSQTEFFTVNSSIYAVPFYQKLGFVPGLQEIKNGVKFVPMKMEL
ncbi:MAG: GNAT family N-acetyltransferase [Pseudobdellovibrionaceae bacterium]|jgi:ribosomal protein S18 acetylase RimI-like enzyme